MSDLEKLQSLVEEEEPLLDIEIPITLAVEPYKKIHVKGIVKKIEDGRRDIKAMP